MDVRTLERPNSGMFPNNSSYCRVAFNSLCLFKFPESYLAIKEKQCTSSSLTTITSFIGTKGLPDSLRFQEMAEHLSTLMNQVAIVLFATVFDGE